MSYAQQVITAYQNDELSMFACIVAISFLRKVKSFEKSLVAIFFLKKVTFEKCQEKRIQLVKKFVDEHNEEIADILDTVSNWVPETLSKCNEDCFNTIEDAIHKLCDWRNLNVFMLRELSPWRLKFDFQGWVVEKRKKWESIQNTMRNKKHFEEDFSEIVAHPFFEKACEMLEKLEKKISKQAERLLRKNAGISIKEAFEQATNSCFATQSVDFP